MERLAALNMLGSMATGALIPVATWVAFHDISLLTRSAGALCYLALLALTFWLHRRYAATLAIELDGLITQMRISAVDRFLRREPLEAESLGGEADLTEAESSHGLLIVGVDSIRSMFAFLIRSMYILALSGTGFLVWCFTVLVITRLGRPLLEATHQAQADVELASRQFKEGLSKLHSDFARVRSEPELHQRILVQLHRASQRRARAQHRLNAAARGIHVGAYGILLLGLGVLLFCGPVARSFTPATRGQVLSLLLFMIPSVLFVLSEVPTVSRLWSSLPGMRTTTHTLKEEEQDASYVPADFDDIQLKGVFLGPDDRRTAHTPVELTIRRGELVIIVRDDRNHAEALARVIAGLVRPELGTVSVRGHDIPQALEGSAVLRELSSTVWSEPFVFDRLYGVQAEKTRVETLLKRVGLFGSVHWPDREAEPTTLSRSQRKRLALVVALLEDRPLIILDDWTAFLDTETQDWFYSNLLPELREEGRTVVVTGADDRYFHVADQVVYLEDVGNIG